MAMTWNGSISAMRVAIGIMGEARRGILGREGRQMLLAPPAHGKLEKTGI